MKNISALASILLLGSLATAGNSNLDLNRGSVLFCRGQVGEVNRVGLQAQISTKRLSDGGLEMVVASGLAECTKDQNGSKSWTPMTKAESKNDFGQLKFSDLRLLITTDEGDLISSTDMKIQDSQVIRIPSAIVKKMNGQLITVGAVGMQKMLINGAVVDTIPVFF